MCHLKHQTCEKYLNCCYVRQNIYHVLMPIFETRSYMLTKSRDKRS